MIEIIYISSDKTEADFKETYAKMPWLTFPYSSDHHANLKKKYEIIGVPMVYVLDAQSGFLITQKGRKDICDLGVSCMKNWEEEYPDMLKKMEHLTKGFKEVEAARIKKEKEEEEKRKAEQDL